MSQRKKPKTTLQHDRRDELGRSYRLACAPRGGEAAFQVVVGETDLHIVAPREMSAEAAELARSLRGQVLAAMELAPDFLGSLEPLDLPPGLPELPRRMNEAGRLCGVGPMAAVAGAIAQGVAEGLSRIIAEETGEPGEVLVENGGDVYCISRRERVIGLLPEPASGVLVGIKAEAASFPLALCASSGIIGHSLSFGQGELAAVRAGNGTTAGMAGVLADAAATAAANMLRSRADLDRVLAFAQKLAPHGVQGVFAQVDGHIAIWGAMELVSIG